VTALATALVELCAADRFDRLEAFVATALHHAGVWASPRVTDGISQCRVAHRDHGRAPLVARIWEIDQTQHVLWLDLHLDGDCGRWTLRYDPEGSPRRVRDAFDSVSNAADNAWRVTLSGELTIRGGALLPAPIGR
jgi:hypothetical protein